MNSVKQLLYDKCKDFVTEKRNRIEVLIKEIHQSMTSESKSTAGDKHETGRAMLQLEREKAGNQLKEIEILETTLKKINPENSNERVALGSYVVTDGGKFYISISAGVLKIKKAEVYAISLQSPIGKLLSGKKSGDTYSFNNKIFKIKEVS